MGDFFFSVFLFLFLDGDLSLTVNRHASPSLTDASL